MGGRLWECTKQVKGIKKYKLPVIKNSQEDVQYSIGNVINNIVIALYGIRCILDLSEGSHHRVYKFINV